MAPREPHRLLARLPALLAAVLLGAPHSAARPEARAVAAAEARNWLTATRFSQLAEVTPANVGGLLPLVARSVTPMLQDRQLEPSAAIEVPLQRFIEERSGALEVASQDRARLRLPAPGLVVSYLVAAAAEDAGAASVGTTRCELRAWDPIEGHVLWSVREALPISSGTLVTAGGLVFYGTADGWFKALDARSGRILWKHRVDGRRLDAPMSYRGADGHQYIAVRALPGSAGDGGETLLFALAH